MTRILFTLSLIFASLPLSATTWYVRSDGGTRYSTNITTGQCDGTADVSYASTGGTGTNQHCAFNDIRMLWADGSYTNNINAGSPAWGWIGAGGDTYIVRSCYNADATSACRIGYSGPNVGNYGFALAGNPFQSGAPPPFSGTSGAHTKILGGNYASCHSASARTFVHGGYGAAWTFQMAGVSYVDVACMDITDYANCGVGGQVNTCGSGFPLQDFAKVAISWSNTSTFDTLTDIHIHGMASVGMLGPTGDGVVMDYIDTIGNASSGYDADGGDGTTGTGNLAISHFNISWNGCVEEYPIVDALPYQDCTDDSVSGGYGDGFGTASTNSTAWHVTFSQGISSYNTQDGLDALHIQGGTSQMTVDRVLAFGNMGNQVKEGSAGAITNSLIVGNCMALSGAIPGTPTGYNSQLKDFCRAGNEALVLSMNNGSVTKFIGNTVYGFQAPIGGGEGDLGDLVCNTTCTTTAALIYTDNILVGFDPSASGTLPEKYTNSTGVDPFTQTGSQYAHNASYGLRTSCPDPSGESNALCALPQLVDTTWHSYGYGNMQPASSSNVVGAGIAVSGLTTDYAGVTRPNPPSMGAYEAAGTPTAATPTASPAAGSYTSAQTVTLSTATGGAAICFTTDGTTPAAATAGTCSHGTTYSAPFAVSATATLKAIATLGGDTNSPVFSGIYTISATVPFTFTVNGKIILSGRVVVQ